MKQIFSILILKCIFLLSAQYVFANIYTMKDLKVLEKRGNFQEFFDHVKDIRPSLRQKDWKKMDVKLINENIALVNAMFSRLNKKGENYFTGAAIYTFRKDNKSWKILSITPYKPYNYFEFD